MKLTKHCMKPLTDPHLQGRKYNRRKEQWNEVKEIAKTNNITYDNWIQRITKLNYDYREAAETPLRDNTITVDGKTMMMKEFYSLYVPSRTWQRWLKKMTFQEALEQAKQRLKDKMGESK